MTIKECLNKIGLKDNADDGQYCANCPLRGRVNEDGKVNANIADSMAYDDKSIQIEHGIGWGRSRLTPDRAVCGGGRSAVISYEEYTKP